MKTMKVRTSGRLLLAVAALPFWLVLTVSAMPLFLGGEFHFSPTDPVFFLIATGLTVIVITGRVPILE